MLDSCTISIPGNRRGNYGKNKSGTIREFLVDNQYYYSIIYKHVKDCDECDPIEIVRFYLNRRMEKQGGFTSVGLLSVVNKYYRLCNKKGIELPIELINEFYWRCRSHEKILSRKSFYSFEEIYKCLKLHASFVTEPLIMLDPRFKLVSMFMNSDPFPGEDEMKKLLEVAEVMYS